MPIFEFACKKCGHGFEALVGVKGIARCPKCQAEELERRLSVFAVGKGGAASRASSPSPCGTCGDPRGPGACRLD
jgi:putative FmdB family regulatory protein